MWMPAAANIVKILTDVIYKLANARVSAPGKLFQHGKMFAGKVSSLPYRVSTRKHLTRLERLARDEHSSL